MVFEWVRAVCRMVEKEIDTAVNFHPKAPLSGDSTTTGIQGVPSVRLGGSKITGR